MSKAQELKALVATRWNCRPGADCIRAQDEIFAAIDAQQSIIDELSAMVPELRGKCDRMRLILAERDAEIERLTKDAERLRAACDYTIRRLQLDIDDGSRPDKWSMEEIVRKSHAAIAAGSPAELGGGV